MARQDCGVRSRYSFIHDNGENLVESTRYAVRPTHNGAGNFERVDYPGARITEIYGANRKGMLAGAYVVGTVEHGFLRLEH
jgi:hypothetical protein